MLLKVRHFVTFLVESSIYAEYIATLQGNHQEDHKRAKGRELVQELNPGVHQH